MKNLKKLLAVVLTFAMVLTTMSAMLTVSAFDDVTSESAYYEAVTVLNQLGIVNGKDATTFGPADPIKRSEAAAILVRMLGLESAADGSKGPTVFTDVAADHWASGYINVAVSQNIVNGMGDGTFAPDADVTYEQFIKMVMVALGYEPIAAAKGGWPTGYMVAASDYKVTEGVAYAGPNAANRGDIALIVYKAIDTPMLEQTGWGNNIDYEVRDGKTDGNKKTLLTEKLGIVKMQATILGTGKSTIDSTYTPVEGAVYVDVVDLYNYDAAEFSDGTYVGGKRAKEVKIKDGGFDLNANMGTDMILFVAKDAYKDNYIKAAVADNSTTVEVVLANKDYFAEDDSDFARNKVNYWVNPETDKRSTEIALDSDIKMIVNGKLIGETVADVQDYFENNWTNGSVRLVNLNSNSDDTVDIIYATRYFQGLVDDVDLETQTIEFDFTAGDQADDICLDPEELDDDFVYTMKDTEGNNLTINDIKANDVLAIAYEIYDDCNIDNNNYMDIIVVRKTVEGTVTEVTGTEFNIGGNYYEKSSSNLGLTISLASEGTFYLDIEGKIIARKVSVGNTNVSNYAVISSIYNASSDPSEADYTVRMMTKDGVVGKYTFAPTVKYVDPSTGVSNTYTENGSINSWAALYAIINGSVTRTGTAPKDRVYSVTTSGSTITRIEKAVSTSVADEEILTVFTPGSAVVYNASRMRFSNQYQVTDATLVFYVKGDDYDKWEVRTASTFVDDKAYESGDVHFFNLDDDKNIGLVLLTDDAGFSAYESGNLALVTRVGTATSTADGVTQVKRLTVVAAGEEKQFELSHNGYDYYEAGASVSANAAAEGVSGDVSMVDLGDAIMYSVNANNQIIALSLVYDASATTLLSNGFTDDNDAVKFVFGAVYAGGASPELGVVDGTSFKLEPAQTAYYAKYDFTSNKTVKGEIAKGSDVRKYTTSNYAYIVARIFEGDAVDYIYYVYAAGIDASNLDITAIS